MGLISNENFLRQQAYLGSGFAGLVLAQNVLMSGLQLVVDEDDADVTVELIGPYDVNVRSMDPGMSASLLNSAWDALQRHVTSHTGQDFNDYLSLRALKVSKSFAALSGELGIPIDPGNIE